jgi:hypothetical protein
VNDLATTHPAIAKTAGDWDPKTVSHGSHKKREWICVLGHRYVSEVAHRVEGKGCPICAGNKVLAGFNDLATTDPELALEAHGWETSSVSRGSGRRFEWKCQLGHIYAMRIPDRRAGQGCPFCSGKRVLAGFNDIASLRPELAAQAFEWEPAEFTLGSNKRQLWRCSECLGIWNASPNTRSKGVGCPYCANKKVLVGHNDLATTNPELIGHIVDGDSKAVTRRSGARFRWRCDAGHEWTATVDKVQSGRWCPECAKTGYKASKDGWLYLLLHSSRAMLQIGITNDPDSRFARHRRNGWQVLDLRGPMVGDLCRRWETQILRTLRDEAEMAAAERFEGSTESWIQSSWPCQRLRTLMDAVEERSLPPAPVTQSATHPK